MATNGNDNSTFTYLVFSATGRQGRAVVKALAAQGDTTIVATSRDPESNSSKNLLKIEQVSKVVKADFNDPESIVSAIKESCSGGEGEATATTLRVWFTTDFWSIPFLKRTRASEAKLGRHVIDSIKKAKEEGCNIQHVVYSSVCDADKVPEKVHHFWGKADVEKYMAAQFEEKTETSWSVIRPVAFMENFDDAPNYNPLTKGYLKFLTYPDKPVKFVACEDIGKASAVLLSKPGDYAGKLIDAAGAEHTALEATKALTEVSGTECKYALGVPRFVMWLFMGDLYHMVTWFEEGGGYSADIDEFKKIVPDAQDAKAFFESKGEWANGEKFLSSD